MTKEDDLTKKIEAERVTHLIRHLKGFNAKTDKWHCPTVSKTNKPCQRKPNPQENLLQLLLSLLQEQENASPPKNGTNENGLNASDLKAQLLCHLIDLVACHDHKPRLKERIAAQAASIPSTKSEQSSTKSDHELNGGSTLDAAEGHIAEEFEPSTPSRVRSGFTSGRAVSYNTSRSTKGLNDSQNPQISSTPVRPAITRSQANGLFVESPSPERESFDNDSTYTGTPQSVFSPSESPYGTPFTPPSTAPVRKNGYVTADLQASPTQARAGISRYNLRPRQTAASTIPQSPDNEAESLPQTREQSASRRLFAKLAKKEPLAGKPELQDEFAGSSLAARSLLSAKEEITTDDGGSEESDDGDDESLVEARATSPEDTREATIQCSKDIVTPRREYPKIPSHFMSEKWAQTPILARHSETHTRHDLFKLIERVISDSEWAEGLIYVAVHRNYVPDDSNDPRRLFKVGLTKTSIKHRYTGKCKVVGKGSFFVARSTKLFKGAKRAEQLIHAELFKERMSFDCPCCTSSPKKGELQKGKSTSHNEWFFTTEAHVMEVVKRWKHFVEMRPYEGQKLRKEAQDFLLSVWESKGLVAGVERALKANSNETREPSRQESDGKKDVHEGPSFLFIYETPQLMADADAAVIVPTSFRYLPDGGISSARVNGIQVVPETIARAESLDEVRDPIPQSLRTHKTQREAHAVRTDQMSDSQLKRSEAARKRWDLALDSWKSKTGMKAMGMKLRRTSVAPPEQVEASTNPQTHPEPKLGLVRRATGKFLKSR